MALTDNLIAYWSLDEASGNAIDAHSTHDLTETSGTIGSASGKVGNCRDFEAGDTEWFEIADNADLSLADEDFTFSAWVQLESKGAMRCILTKDNGSAGEYYFQFDNAADRFELEIWNGPGYANKGEIQANNLGSPSLSTWYFLVAWYDASANTLNIQANNGTVDSVSFSGGTQNNTGKVYLGSSVYDQVWDGLIDEVGFWKRVLTSDERTTLYNAGAGLAYPFGGGGGGATFSELVNGGLIDCGLINGGLVA